MWHSFGQIQVSLFNSYLSVTCWFVLAIVPLHCCKFFNTFNYFYLHSNSTTFIKQTKTLFCNQMLIPSAMRFELILLLSSCFLLLADWSSSTFQHNACFLCTILILFVIPLPNRCIITVIIYYYITLNQTLMTFLQPYCIFWRFGIFLSPATLLLLLLLLLVVLKISCFKWPQTRCCSRHIRVKLQKFLWNAQVQLLLSVNLLLQKDYILTTCQTHILHTCTYIEVIHNIAL